MANTKETSTKKKSTTSSKTSTTAKKTSTTRKTTPTKKTTTKTTVKKVAEAPKIKKVEITEIKKPEKQQEVKSREQETNTFLIVLGIIVLAIVAVLIFSLTYAYFYATVKEMNPGTIDAQIVTADLLVRYQDGDSNVELGSKIEPGDILTKKFSVKNEGNDTGIYTVVLENIEHNLGHKETEEEKEVLKSDITYKLLKLDTINNETTETVVATGTLPFKSGTDSSAFIIYTKDEVLRNTTNTYRLELTYVNHPNIDQSDSMGESLKLKVNIVNYEGERRTES